MASNVNTAARAFYRQATRFSKLLLKLKPVKGDTADYGAYPAGPMAVIQLPPGFTGDVLQIQDYLGNVLSRLTGFDIGVAHALYDFAVDGGAIAAIVPKTNSTIPAKALVFGGLINVTTAVLAAGGAANVSLGTSAGSSATAILGATAKATFALNAILATVPVFTAATTFKMTADGKIIVTPDTNALTAGVFDVFVFYVKATN